MGVTACGKSTVAEKLAEQLDAVFIEADELHPPKNILKMKQGNPLTDKDRWPWLEQVASEINSCTKPAIVSCSALRRAYRDKLRLHTELPMHFIHIFGTRDVLAQRMASRQGHFMPVSLLDSQINLLEPLEVDETGTEINAEQCIEDVVKEAMEYVQSSG